MAAPATAQAAPLSANAPNSGSMTTTGIISTGGRAQAVLRLRGANEEGNASVEEVGRGRGRRIQWAEDVVDNEGLGRKSSKVCCIYHAPRPIDESSDESSSDSDDSSSDDDDDDRARPMGGGKGKRKEHGDDCGHGHAHAHGKGKGKGGERKRSPNAYERQPSLKGKSTA
ncbi:Type 1 phosphatases regulator ypi1 [Clarireedia jacksonii]